MDRLDRAIEMMQHKIESEGGELVVKMKVRRDCHNRFRKLVLTEACSPKLCPKRTSRISHSSWPRPVQRTKRCLATRTTRKSKRKRNGVCAERVVSIYLRHSAVYIGTGIHAMFCVLERKKKGPSKPREGRSGHVPRQLSRPAVKFALNICISHPLLSPNHNTPHSFFIPLNGSSAG